MNRTSRLGEERFCHFIGFERQSLWRKARIYRQPGIFLKIMKIAELIGNKVLILWE